MKLLPTACVLLSICVCSTLAGLFGRTQSIAVKGQLMCGSQMAGNVRVILVDKDTGGPDDEMDANYSSANGKFHLSGSASDATPLDNIDVELKLYHDCNDGVNPCQRKWKFIIPEDYITKGKTPKKTFDLGIINLEVVMDDEERDCIH